VIRDKKSSWFFVYRVIALVALVVKKRVSVPASLFLLQKAIPTDEMKIAPDETLSPFGETLSPFGETLSPFGETLSPFDGTLSPFDGTLSPFDGIFHRKSSGNHGFSGKIVKFGDKLGKTGQIFR
jgi:hypothetical protein